MFRSSRKRCSSAKLSKLGADFFECEQDLVDLFSEVCIQQNVARISREFDSGFGIADLVLYKPSTNLGRSTDIKDLSSKWAYTLKALPYRRIFSTDDLCSMTGASLPYTKRMLQSFLDLGYITPGKTPHTWSKRREPLKAVREIIAVEAKVSHWRRALFQATRYKHFAHSAWVVLDASRCNPAISNVATFEHFNVGLSSIDTSGDLKIHHSPQKVKPLSDQLFWSANVKLSRKFL